MPDENKPALTAEEWRVINTGHGISRNTEEGRWDGEPPFTDYGFRVSGHPSGWMYVGRYDADSRPGGGGWRMLAQVEIRRPDERHMLAAVALQRQPFGFTSADVELLHDAHDALVEVSRDGEESARGAAALHLADRIAALLPPEESHV